MIDMRSLYVHRAYNRVLSAFTNSLIGGNCNHESWGLFNLLHLSITQGRCPICECRLDGSTNRDSNGLTGTTLLNVSMDHYRPQNHYPFLKCEDKNFLLMCSDCNGLKDNDFPLYQNTLRETNIANLHREQALLVNPIYDDVNSLFTLVFRRNTRGMNVLELIPKKNTSQYMQKKAQKSIDIFGLASCSTLRSGYRKNCRIDIQNMHYGVLKPFASVMKKLNQKAWDMEKLKVSLLNLLRDNKSLYESYGFYKFIRSGNFILLEQ